MIAPGDVRAVVGRGMPVQASPFVKGDLLIHFDVIFPKPRELTAAQVLVTRVVLFLRASILVPSCLAKRTSASASACEAYWHRVPT